MNQLTDPILRPAHGSAVPMPDVQGSRDLRNLPIERVGVRGLRYPILIEGGRDEPEPSVAEFSLSVALPGDQKGTHMSRFVALLEAMNRRGQSLGPSSLVAIASEMLSLLEAPEGTIELEAPFFIEKTAPVSGVKSLMDYRVGFRVEANRDQVRVALRVKVPVKSLCPCSKEISAYGAHNQRSEISVEVVLQPQAFVQSNGSPAASLSLPKVVDWTVRDLIQAIEAQASCELWGLLKRPDEKYVTERAYDNAKFVEDLVRDVAMAVRALPGVVSYKAEAENFESIHNHSAWARISG